MKELVRQKKLTMSKEVLEKVNNVDFGKVGEQRLRTEASLKGVEGEYL